MAYRFERLASLARCVCACAASLVRRLSDDLAPPVPGPGPDLYRQWRRRIEGPQTLRRAHRAPEEDGFDGYRPAALDLRVPSRYPVYEKPDLLPEERE